jgi:signal transduction histidine kinase
MGAADISALGWLQTGWPLGLVLATLIVADRVREARRRESLNRAIHELRRPLQALVLSTSGSRDPGRQSVGLALAALGDLDRTINGGARRFAPRPVACRALVQSAVERWRGIAAASDRSLVLHWHAGSAAVMADPGRLAQALDNLIHNAILHGGLRVRVQASVFAGGVRISVADSGPSRSASRGRDHPRHGHGLRIVSAIAAEHGGRFLLRTSALGTTATLELPFAPIPSSAAEDGRAASGRASRRVTPLALVAGGRGDEERIAGRTA